MGYFYPGVVYWKLCFFRGQHMPTIFAVWVALTSWIAYAAAINERPVYSEWLTGSGIIQSFFYPLNYPDNIELTWRLQSRSINDSIRLNFDSFNTEMSVDVLRIYDEKRVVNSFSGSSLPPIMTLGRTAELVFTTDTSINLSGFKASFTSFDTRTRAQCLSSDVYWCANSRQCISRSWRCDYQKDCPQGEDERSCYTTASASPPCGGTVVGAGVIQSTNYPRNYPDNARCIWRLFSNAADTVVKIQFRFFHMENNHDFVTVYDMNSLSKKYTGYRSQFTLLLGREARIEFNSDQSNNTQGFTAQFASVNVATLSQCLASDTFWCTSHRKCIGIAWRCDGYQDCKLGEDEYMCSTTTISSTKNRQLSPQSDCLRYGQFWCSRSATCIALSYRCDNYNDCTYGEDEANCSMSMSTGTIAGIVAGSVGGVAVLIYLVIRRTNKRRLRRANQTSNNYLQTASRPSATVYATPATNASQFGAPNRQAGGPSESGDQSMDLYAPPSYDATMKAYGLGQYVYPPAQSGAIHKPLNAPSTGDQPTN